nr:MAG TPA: hypothetical protein [Bacteriophage sp.]
MTCSHAAPPLILLYRTFCKNAMISRRKAKNNCRNAK